jgi:hypothetical protein
MIHAASPFNRTDCLKASAKRRGAGVTGITFDITQLVAPRPVAYHLTEHSPSQNTDQR